MMEDNSTGLLWLALLGTPIKYEETLGNSWGLEDGQNEGQAVIRSSVWLWRIMCWKTREKGIILWDKVISREDPGSVWKMDCGKSSKGGFCLLVKFHAVWLQGVRAGSKAFWVPWVCWGTSQTLPEAANERILTGISHILCVGSSSAISDTLPLGSRLWLQSISTTTTSIITFLSWIM